MESVNDIYFSDHDAVKLRITTTLIGETFERNFYEFYSTNLFAKVSSSNFSCFHS